MTFKFKILEPERIHEVVPLVYKLNEARISTEVLQKRFLDMVTQHYECAVVFDEDNIIGVCGLWFCTRHYSGNSVEPDHVYIDDAYRGTGLGHRFFNWIYDYVQTKGVEAIELNTYVTNALSHKFYFKEGFEILGFHFLKKL
ncbi:GNAT family N-acetyltransferase [Tamlana fucoidanivorans]|uniref:GNAT family N-acetyltransferase n=1 Tax=Allotamlana fucoidanivorans TaxID=2583814 RepID=A0A5C4SKU9_9FLAO|nr:GNAT family N-acetyltransferase [Tamlana fucoidanivorans]TNJ44627.1 GNAT family N-acetyltransferase [Tamlana fucoidanivorans]